MFASSAGSSRQSRTRAFICYSHHDFDLAKVVCDRLSDCGLSVKWDQAFAVGRGFHDQIRTCIGCAHVFVPVLTRRAIERGWVQQEIGYAMAMNIPVLPVAIGVDPGEMIGEVHAVKVSRDRVSDAAAPGGDTPPDARERRALIEHLQSVVAHKLDADLLHRLVEQFSDPALARYEVAEFQEERTQMMARYAETAWDLLIDENHPYGGPGLIRQMGGLSSFHIPDDDLMHPIWKMRYGQRQHSRFHCKLQRLERTALARHLAAGARLIVNPYHTYVDSGPRAYAARLLSLLRFLIEVSAPQEDASRTADGSDEGEEPGKPLVQIVIDPELGFHESETSVGNCFTAAAVSGSSSTGYHQTVFTTHGPSMSGRQARFDGRFAQLLKLHNLTPETCVATTIQMIDRILTRSLGITDGLTVNDLTLCPLAEPLPETYRDAKGRPSAEWRNYCKANALEWPPKPPVSPPAVNGVNRRKSATMRRVSRSPK